MRAALAVERLPARVRGKPPCLTWGTTSRRRLCAREGQARVPPVVTGGNASEAREIGGDDLLSGGDGSDVFVFLDGSTILDFKDDVDTIFLDEPRESRPIWA